MRHARNNNSGSALIWTVCVITVLSIAAAEILRTVSSKYHNVIHTAAWQESLLAAESGVDLAIIELRKSLYPDPNHAWDPAKNWSNTPGDGVVSHGLATVPNAGLSGLEMTVEVNVDAPLQLKDPVNGWQYYRVRTIGTMPITGPARAADNKQDTRLRKMSLNVERFAGTPFAPASFQHPQVSRRIEAIVRPVSAFDLAIMSVGQLDLTDQNIVIDSYDSRDPNKSTNGLYPGPTAQNADGTYKRQENGDIATDGTIINAGNAYVHGDVATNAGTVTGIANVTGQERDDFYQEPIPVPTPSWPSVNPSPSSVSGTQSIAAKPMTSPDHPELRRYVLSSISMAGNDVLTLTGNADGSPSYVEIYVTGDVAATGNAQIVIAPGVHAKIYFGGNVNIAGNGVVNSNGKPGDLLLYGITPSDGSSRSLQLGGNSQLSAAVNAPAYDVQINNGGTKGSVYGSFVGKTVKMNGVTDLHYDEALGNSGAINNYKIVSWFEDTR